MTDASGDRDAVVDVLARRWSAGHPGSADYAAMEFVVDMAHAVGVRLSVDNVTGDVHAAWDG